MEILNIISLVPLWENNQINSNLSVYVEVKLMLRFGFVLSPTSLPNFVFVNILNRLPGLTLRGLHNCREGVESAATSQDSKADVVSEAQAAKMFNQLRPPSTCITIRFGESYVD